MKQGKFLAIAAIIWGFLVFVMVGGMVYFTYGYAKEPKNVTSSISNSMEKQEISEVGEESYTVYPLVESSRGDNYITLPYGTELSQIRVKNDYLRHCVYIYVENGNSSFYGETNSFYGGEEIQGVFHYRGHNQDAFILLLDDLYECEYEMKDGSLFLSVERISQKYDRLVILDVETDSKETTDMAIGIIDAQLSVDDTKILFINHNEFHQEYGDEINQLLQVIETSNADFYIQLTTGQENEIKTEGMRAYYQKHFFSNGFGSIELADSLERNMVTEVSGSAMGLYEAHASMQELLLAGIPSARLYIGSYANEEEALMLDSELFWEKAGVALWKTIMQAYGE